MKNKFRVTYPSIRYPDAAPHLALVVDNTGNENNLVNVKSYTYNNKKSKSRLKRVILEINPKSIAGECLLIEDSVTSYVKDVLSSGLSIRQEDLEIAVKVLARSHERAATQAYYETIPLYSDEKARRKDLGEKWSAVEHYEAFWRTWEVAGYLYLDQLRKCDKGLIDALTGWCRRNDEDTKQFLPPTKSSRINKIADGTLALTKEEQALAKAQLHSRSASLRYYDKKRTP